MIKKEFIEQEQETDYYTKILLDATPLGCVLLKNNFEALECNLELLNLLGLQDKHEFYKLFPKLSPEYQPCGKLSIEKSKEYLSKAFNEGYCRFEWVHNNMAGELILFEITLVRVKHRGDYAVAGYLRDLREYNKMMEKIKQRDHLLNTVNKMASLLLTTDDKGNMLSSIMAGAELLGRSVYVDRVQIWRNEIREGSLHFVHKCEWLSEIGKKNEPVPIGLHFPYSSMPEWEISFMRGECINGPLDTLPKNQQDFLGSYDIQSIVIIPLFLHNRFWGFFSLDDCRERRKFGDDEINILRFGGLLIANAFLRNEMLQNIRNGTALLGTALKEAQEANKAKSKFLAAMSHEIRTPMNVILGVAESQLLNSSSSKEEKESFEKIFDSGNLLLRIINDILDLSKIEAGKFELIPVNYETQSLINDVANMGSMKFGQNQNIVFKLTVNEHIPRQLFGDELRIKQILNNILSNAFKYTNSGEVLLSFNHEETDDKKTTLVIFVKDTGQGMTEEQIQKLFDEYSRFNQEANRATVGTGLGMAITHNLVKMMKGKIFINSMPGEGTTFTVHIPQEVTGTETLGSKAAEKLQNFNFSGTAKKRLEALVRKPMPNGKVLVVDDMKSNLDVARLLLKPYQLQITTAASGLEAVELIKDGNEYDIVFMDHMMPVMDGIEATKKIRTLGYAKAVFALTANAIIGQQEIFLANGFDGYISKPIDIRQLNDTLNKFIVDKI